MVRFNYYGHITDRNEITRSRKYATRTRSVSPSVDFAHECRKMNGVNIPLEVYILFRIINSLQAAEDGRRMRERPLFSKNLKS